jgi:hypothetical protein
VTNGQTTTLGIEGQKFLIDGDYTYRGRSFGGFPVEGLLFNVRAVQATFDDENYPQVTSYDTAVGRRRFVYPDAGRWDADRNVEEFIFALPQWREMGVLAVTVNFQGGRPVLNAWKAEQDRLRHPYLNSGFTAEGALKPAYARRMARVLDALDEQGMVAIVGYFYCGQDYRLRDEAAVLRAVDEATGWLLVTEHQNILIEVCNEVDPRHYSHEVLKPERVVELIERVKSITLNSRRLLASTSFTPGFPPTQQAIATSDVILPHGNGLSPQGHRSLVERLRSTECFRAEPKPILFNESGTNAACLDAGFRSYASWGYYDHGANNYHDGFQSPPVNWRINTPAKRAFFERVRQITGAEASGAEKDV